jgi:aldehyde dehydrogenase (NAD+)
LLFSPLVGALAAGNSVCLKPSEHAPRVSAAVAGIVRETFDAAHVTVFEGDAEVARSLTGLGFDHVFFTGSAEIGRRVLAAAAARLTPVTLELGGKSPCIVCSDARLPVAARRIAWGKFLNAGQTCVAPDHVLVHESVKTRLVEELRGAIREFFGDDPRSSPDYGRIVNERQFSRLKSYLDQGEILAGGESEASELYIAPTLLADPDPASPVMREEIFGPILPVIGFGALDRLLERLRTGPAPLALYLFSEDAAIHERVLARTISGGVCINDVVVQITAKELPFGGRGESGMGQYHGKAGFDCFTHYRSVMRRSTRFDPGYLYPPGRFSLEQLRKSYRFFFDR